MVSIDKTDSIVKSLREVVLCGINDNVGHPGNITRYAYNLEAGFYVLI